MDAAVLDREYNARATTPDVLEILAEYRARTDAAKAVLPWSTHAYGPGEPERLDVYPAASGPAPVLVFIHGGYWRALDAADSGSMAPGFVAAGACVVSVNYSLAPAAGLDRIVDECRRALAWVHGNIARFGGDPSRIHVAGSSAGGHLAAMLMAPGWQAGMGLPARPIAGATLLSGLFDLTPIPHTHINGWMSLDAEGAARNSPALLPLPSGLPVVLAHGDTETAEFKRQTVDFAAALRGAGCAADLVPPRPGSNHFDLVFDFGEPGNPLFEATRRAMGL
ncbi:alpha/beta hydrolase [Roseomonas sp. SSH11]|uniref:Alpha/beta hydrolase n=2 Tax=Pararoseomonas baculiformis TaxID=2820812 RepID=A0ABS4ACG2_9PROT|nr:alpha/beta hydrolase [Pararoseomonas baculiformis]MBP0444696.1 alpha/beta hydrolase [Pararoseomonas baculiformis]